MKNIQVHQSFLHHTAPSRPGQTSLSLACFAFIASCLFTGTVAQAQTLQLRLPFTQVQGSGTTTPSDTTGGGIDISLTMKTNISASTGGARDLNGYANSGVNGSATGIAGMDFTTNFTIGVGLTQPAGGNGNIAVDLNDATLASGLGNSGLITNFVATLWFKQVAAIPANIGPRMWILNAGAAGVDSGANTNTIGLKFQGANQIYLQLGLDTVTVGPALPSGIYPTNQWLFIAVVYDGTNASMYYGSDTAPSVLLGTGANEVGRVVNLGSAACLSIGNRTAGTRGFNGWINDFRFYSGGVPTNKLVFVDNIRKQIAPPLPTITGIYPDGTALLQNTNTLVFTATSTGPNNFTNISLVLNSVNVSGSLQFVTNGTAGTATNVTATYTGLQPQTVYTAVISAANSLGLVGTATVNFDTFDPANFIVKAEEFDFNSGQFIDDPVYTNVVDPPGVTNTYYGLDSVEGVDTHKGQSTGDFQATDYRYDDGTGLRTQTPLAAGELPSPTRFGSGIVPNHMIGNWSSAEWQNYTKTYPAGLYNVFARVSTSSGSTINFDQVISGQGTPSQTLSRLGSFTFSGSGAFQWVALKSYGQLAVVNLAGVNTVRATTGGGANANLYMLVPANTNVPTITSVYPDGQYLFEPTNKLVFTVTSGAANINTADIHLTVGGTNVDASLSFSGGPSTWNCSYTGLQLNQTYAVVIQVTDNNANSATATLTIDTWNPVLQVEAEDFDFNPTKSLIAGTGARFIDNPGPTPPLVPAANSYEGQVGDTFIDEQGNNTLQPGQTPISVGFAGATFANYRTNDPCATAPITDNARRQFTGGALDYNVGFLGPGHWEQYTRTWPGGTFNLYARVASGANLGTLYSSWSQVIAGWGTTNQVTRHIGSFAIPSSGGYSSYFYTPLIDQFGNYAQLTLGGTNTFRDTHLVYNQTETANTAVYGLNINFYMLLAARTDLPRIDNVYPDGTVLMQQTNTLAFVASSPTYGLSTTGIVVTLNGNNISPQLVFGGSSPSLNVSYPGLQPNSNYTAVISVTDFNNQTHSTTVNFDTFSANNYTWEAENFDFDPTLSPVPNGSGHRYIDGAILTSATAPNSYFGQTGDGGQPYAPGQIILPVIDYAQAFNNVLPSPTVYRTNEVIPIAVTSDARRQNLLNAQLQQINPYIQNYDIYNLTNGGWINYTRTFPSGNFYLYARLSAGNTLTNFQCAQVVSGAGTTLQVSNILGSFQATGDAYATWKYAQLMSNSLPAVLSLGGVETLQMSGDWNERVDFFILVPVVANPVSIMPSINGANIQLSFPTQTGHTYTMYYKNNLTDSSWTLLVGGGNPVTGNGLTQSVTDGLGPGHRFYLLTIQ